MGPDRSCTIDAAPEVAGGVLADHQRRRVLDILQDASEPLGLADLARDLARQELSTEEGDVSEVAKRYRIELHHKHVPKLADAGYITFDEERRTVALGSNATDNALDELAALYH